jgi:ketosteroid isomerase-like protein
VATAVAGYEHVPFIFRPGKKVGGSRIADDPQQAAARLTPTETRSKTMTPDHIRQIFKGLETGDGAAFFVHVADDVDWTVMGTHPLAGHYHSRADYAGTFAKLSKVLPHGAQLHVEHLVVKDDEAVVELRSLATAINGMRFDNRYCMVLAFDGEAIVRARTYLDSAMVARLFEENPIA